MFKLILTLLLASVFLNAKPLTVENKEFPLSQKETVSLLQNGGYIVYYRHNSTNRTQTDKTTNLFEDCSLQRNLSDLGVNKSKNIAKAIKKLNIPIGTVFSSPYCRCKDTAKYTLGKFKVDDNLRFALTTDIAETNLLSTHLQNLFLTETIPNNKNIFFVSHTANLKEAVDIWPKPEGVMVVFKRTANKKLKLIGKIEPEFWNTVLK